MYKQYINIIIFDTSCWIYTWTNDWSELKLASPLFPVVPQLCLADINVYIWPENRNFFAKHKTSLKIDTDN